MTILLAEAAPALEAGAAGEGAGAAAGGAGDATTVFSKPAAKAPPAPKAKAAPKAKKPAAPNVPMSLRRSKTSEVYGKRANKPASPYQTGKSKAAKGAAFFKPPNLLASGGGVAHKIVIAEFVACVVMIGADPVLTRKPADSHLYLANDFVRLTAVCGLFFVLALAANTDRMAKISAAFGGLVTLGILFNAAPAFYAISSVFTASTAVNKQGGTVQAADAGTATVDRATYTPVDLMADPSANAQRGSAATGTATGGGVIAT
jgi:hypothetical protein